MSITTARRSWDLPGKITIFVAVCRGDSSGSLLFFVAYPPAASYRRTRCISAHLNRQRGVCLQIDPLKWHVFSHFHRQNFTLSRFFVHVVYKLALLRFTPKRQKVLPACGERWGRGLIEVVPLNKNRPRLRAPRFLFALSLIHI